MMSGVKNLLGINHTPLLLMFLTPFFVTGVILGRPVSYTHLDVYKRQLCGLLKPRRDCLRARGELLDRRWFDAKQCGHDLRCL